MFKVAKILIMVGQARCEETLMGLVLSHSPKRLKRHSKKTNITACSSRSV